MPSSISDSLGHFIKHKPFFFFLKMFLLCDVMNNRNTRKYVQKMKSCEPKSMNEIKP